MKSKLLISLYVCLVLVGSLLVGNHACAETPATDLFRARIGIELQYENESRSAKLRGERLLVGDQYRIYVAPESEDCYVYVVTTNGDVTTVVSAPEKIVTAQGPVFLLPSLTNDTSSSDEASSDNKGSFYRIEKGASELVLSVLCSAEPVPELEQFAENHEIPTEEWKILEQQLIEKHTIELPGKLPEKPWKLAGSTRSLPPPALPPSVATFLETLKISSGNILVLKQYEFQIHPQE